MDRDPRERVVSVAYYALVKLAAHDTKAATDAADARWFPISKVPKLAFDHAEILATALARLKGKVRYQPIGFELLPPKFTLSQLQHLYEAVLGNGVGQAELPQEGPGLWPAGAAQGNPDDRTSSPGAIVPLRRGQIREAQETRIQF